MHKHGGKYLPAVDFLYSTELKKPLLDIIKICGVEVCSVYPIEDGEFYADDEVRNDWGGKILQFN